MKEKEIKRKRQVILEFMSEKSYVPMKARQMASLFMVEKKDFLEFRELLNELEEEYKVRKNKKSQYIICKEDYEQGVFKVHEKGYGFVIRDNNEDDIYIPEGKTKGALNQDVVLVRIVKEKEDSYSAEGEIVKVIKHEKQTLVGIFQKSRNFGFVVPDDKKLGSDIFVSKKKFLGAKDGQKVVVKITVYPKKGKKAEGEIIEILGNPDEAGIDVLSFVKEYNLPYEFPKPVLQEAEKINQEVELTKNRLDLRKETIFTIDGPDAKDLDDAVAVKKLENGNYQLNVSIADVSHYVKENTNLDREAVLRGTSVYFLDTVIPMLPEKLSNGICSLNAGEDRYTLSVLMEIDQKGKVVSSEIHKAIICVTKRMSYPVVQKILDGQDKEVLEEYKLYLDHFKNMEELAKILKERRIQEGSLNLEIPESKVILDKQGKAIGIEKYENTFANEIIEQFMLTANETVAERFFWLEAPFIYRVHEQPDLDKVEELNKLLFNLGYKIKVNQDIIYSKSFAEVLEKAKGTEEEKIISNFILHTLKIARYEKENKGHFGLSSKYYCHFTSPIRRYPDLFIHRIISKYIQKNYQMEEEEKQKYLNEAEEYAKTSSECEKVAQKVERESVEMKKAEYMQDKIGEEYEAIVSNVTPFGIFVELENTIEGLIRFENLGNEYFEYDDEHKQLIGERSKTVYKIGDRIYVRLIEANKALRKISFEKIDKK